MLNNIIADRIYDRASNARDMLYISENVKDTQVSEALLRLDARDSSNGYFIESDVIPMDEESDIVEAIDQVEISKEEIDDEIENIIDTDKPIITIDEVMGIADNVIEPNAGLTVDEVMNSLNSKEE